MNRILISWIAYNNDFIMGDYGREVKIDGTTASFHQYFFEEKYEKHLILSTALKDDNRMDHLVNYLNRTYPERKVEPVYLGVSDVIDLEQIIAKVSPLLLSLKDHFIDIFISPGTPTMQTAWYLAHMNLGINTKLLQVRPKEKTKSKGKPELVHILTASKEVTTAMAVIRQGEVGKGVKEYSHQNFFKSESIKIVYRQAWKIAQAENVTVLIQGATGTGKERLAKYIHEESPRRGARFSAINCSAFGDELLESRLFGHKKGAFTSADRDHEGVISSAQGGTVFLDEIGDISPYMQQALLRVLQEKEIAPIGGESKKVDVRFVAATNKDLFQLCEEGKFRWDLYYRLSIVDLELPSLQEQGKKTVEAFLDFFIRRKKEFFNVSKPLQLSKDIKEKLINYSYPGNIRELENLVERLYVLRTDKEIQSSDLPQRMLSTQSTSTLSLEDAVQLHIKKVWAFNKGKQRKTARDLGISYNTLIKKAKNYGLLDGLE